MKQKFLHFLCKKPGMISINGQHIGTIDNLKCFELDVISKTNQLYLSYLPISDENQLLPYSAILNVSDTPSTNNININIVPFPNDNYDIIISPFQYTQNTQPYVLFNGEVGKYFVSIVSDLSTKIIIYSGISIVFNINIPIITAVKVEDCKSIITIRGIINDLTYYLLVIDTNNFSVLYNDITHSIEDNNNSISIYKKLNTLCHHAKICNIDYINKTTEQYYVFQDKEPNKKFSNILIPQAFLECIQINDEKTAKSFMADKFSNTSIDQLKNYFGDIQEIYLNRHDVCHNKLNYTIKTNTWRNFNFLLDNNLIYDIEEIF